MEPALPVGQRPSVSHSAHCGTGTGGTGGFSGGTVVEDPGDSGDVGPPPPGSGRPPGEGHGHPLQCSCLENSVHRGAGWAAVRGVTKSQTRLRD